MTDMGDKAKTIIKETIVLDKIEFDDEGNNGILVERVHLTNGEITKHEFFENGEPVDTMTGGTNATN